MKTLVDRIRELKSKTSPGWWQRGGYISLEEMPAPEYKLTVYHNDNIPVEKWTRGIDVYHGGDAEFIVNASNHILKLCDAVELMRETLIDIYGDGSYEDIASEVSKETLAKVQALLKIEDQNDCINGYVLNSSGSKPTC